MTLPRPRSTFLIIFSFWLVSTLLWITPGITRPDGAGYFVYLPSTWFDRDLLFFDEWQLFGMIRGGRIDHKEVTVTDHLGNHWTSGSSLFWFPSFAAGDLFRVTIPLLGQFPRNGVSLPYNVGVVFASAVAGLLTLLAGASLAERLTSKSAAVIAALGIWLGSPLAFYSLKNAITAHAVSALVCCLVVVLAVRARDDPGWKLMFLTGLAAGYAFAVRPQNGLFFIVVLIVAGGPSLIPAGKIAWYIAGILFGVLPQLVVSTFLYGNPISFLTGGSRATPYAAFERVWLWEPIFSWYHGMVPWTPLLAVACTGLFVLYRSDRRLALAAAFAILSQWLVNAAFERSFWGAFAFGQRRFDNCTVFFLLGAAALFHRLGRVWSMAITFACVAWTLSIFFAASSTVDLNRYYTPSELLTHQMSAVSEAGSHLSVLSYVPDAMKAIVLLLLLLFGSLWLAAAFLLRRFRAASAPIAAAYLVAASLWFLICGLGDRARIPQYRALIELNRPLAALPGGVDVRTGLLSDEAEYLEKSGRAEEAARTRVELDELRRRRNEAMRR